MATSLRALAAMSRSTSMSLSPLKERCTRCSGRQAPPTGQSAACAGSWLLPARTTPWHASSEPGRARPQARAHSDPDPRCSREEPWRRFGAALREESSPSVPHLHGVNRLQHEGGHGAGGRVREGPSRGACEGRRGLRAPAETRVGGKGCCAGPGRACEQVRERLVQRGR